VDLNTQIVNCKAFGRLLLGDSFVFGIAMNQDVVIPDAGYYVTPTPKVASTTLYYISIFLKGLSSKSDSLFCLLLMIVYSKTHWLLGCWTNIDNEQWKHR
jgi:hypothetical protein